MGRGLGNLQLYIKDVLTNAYEKKFGALSFAYIRAGYAIQLGCAEEGPAGETIHNLDPSEERSLKRALYTLVKRGDVVIIKGEGGVADPYQYTTIECFARSANKKPKSTEHAKQIVADMGGVSRIMAMGKLFSELSPKARRR